MALDATSFVGQGMHSLDTIPVITMATKPAWRAGQDRIAIQLCAVRAAATNMASVSILESAGASMVGKGSIVISAFRILDVSMALALNHGNVSVKPTGAVSFVTKTLTIVELINLV